MDNRAREMLAQRILPYETFISRYGGSQRRLRKAATRVYTTDKAACARYWKFVLHGNDVGAYEYHEIIAKIKRYSCYYLHYVDIGFGACGVFQTLKNWGRRMLVDCLGYGIDLKMLNVDEMREAIGFIHRTKPNMVEEGHFNPDFRRQEVQMRRVAKREDYKRQRELGEFMTNIRLKRPREPETPYLYDAQTGIVKERPIKPGAFFESDDQPKTQEEIEFESDTEIDEPN